MKGDKQSSQFKFSHSVVLPPIRLRETFYRSTIRQLDLQRCRQQLNNTRQIAKSRNSWGKCFFIVERLFLIHICKYKVCNTYIHTYYVFLRLALQLSPPGIFLAVATGEDTAPSTESIQSFYLWPREMFIQRFLRLESLYPSLPVAPAPAEYNRLEPGMSLTYRCYLSSGLKKTYKFFDSGFKAAGPPI